MKLKKFIEMQEQIEREQQAEKDAEALKIVLAEQEAQLNKTQLL